MILGLTMYIFIVMWRKKDDSGFYAVPVEASHPGEVWGQIWPDREPPYDAEIVDTLESREEYGIERLTTEQIREWGKDAQ